MLGSNPGLFRLWQWQPDALTTRLDLIHTGLDLIHTGLDLIHTGLDLIHTGLDLIHTGLDLVHTGVDLIYTLGGDILPKCAFNSFQTKQELTQEYISVFFFFLSC